MLVRIRIDVNVGTYTYVYVLTLTLGRIATDLLLHEEDFFIELADLLDRTVSIRKYVRT